jgi:hypothetical protein
MASIAGPPMGNCPNRRPSWSTRCMALVNSGNSGVGTQSRPLASTRACQTWMISSISSGLALKTTWAITAYKANAPTPSSAAVRAGRALPRRRSGRTTRAARAR